MSYRSRCLIGVHVYRKADLTGSFVLQDDMSYMRTGLTGGYVL